jgi:hypothetical protein
MAVENIPWTIQGGKHSAASARRVLFHSTGGAEGIASLGDMRVLQQTVATGSVKVTPGSCVMLNRYPGAINEAYDGRVISDTTVAIATNGSGATRYDLVIARIDDWNVAGQQATPGVLPTDSVAAFKLAVITGVSSTTKTTKQLGLTYPAIALARIAIPAATSSITQAMITDLREKAVPRRLRRTYTRSLNGADTDTLSGINEVWPDVASFNTEVPDWATQANMTISWFGVKVPASSTRVGTLQGRIGAGTASPQDTQTTWFVAGSPATDARHSFGVADDLVIPASLRGTTVLVQAIGSISSGAGNYLVADNGTSVVIDIEWLEAPSEDV